ncbi:MAG: uroporphyrinogen decarboxylase [Beijerinckiaceae bacterium]|nr:uroporphyrinogen decarboxylase [Beijerinckiaceae bacterium]
MSGEARFPPPVWLMRQAGRYLPEYQALRAKASSFLDFCYTPALAAEATLQPVRRFGFDAAILFSDILVIPDALGQKVRFEEGGGPALNPILSEQDFGRLKDEINRSRLNPIFEAIERVKAQLPAETALLGFCGAPWTLACYMIGGKSTPEQSTARMFAYCQRVLFQRLIDRLVQAAIDHLSLQIEAGADAVQIFDSWAGVLPPAEFERWCLEPVAAIISGLRLRHGDARIICFPKGAGHKVKDFAARTKADALSLDTSIDPKWAAKVLDPGLVLQGNLDPVALAAGGIALENGVHGILSAFRSRPHIFNLGHGVLPYTPISHVELMLNLIRGGSVS